MKTIAYIISTYHIGIYDLDIRDVLKSHIIARYYGGGTKRGRPRGRDDNPIYLLLQCHQEMGIQSQGNRNPSST